MRIWAIFTISLVLCGGASSVAAVDHLAFGPAGQWLYLQDQAKPLLLQVLDGRSGEAVAQVPFELTATQRVMGFTPDGFKLAVLGPNGLSILHNKTAKTLRTLRVPVVAADVAQYRPLTALTNASGTAQLFHAIPAQQLQLIHTGNGQVLGKVPLATAALHGMGLSADGRWVAYLASPPVGQAELVLYDLFQQQEVQRLKIPLAKAAPFYWISVSPDGRYGVVAGQLVEWTTGKLQPLQGADSTGGMAWFSPDGQQLYYSGAASLYQYQLASAKQQAVHAPLVGCSSLSAWDVNATQTALAVAYRCAHEIKALVLDPHTAQVTQRWSFKPNF